MINQIITENINEYVSKSKKKDFWFGLVVAQNNSERFWS